MKDYFVLALGNLRHRGLRSWLTLIGILIGVTAVVSLVMLGDGLKSAVSSQFGVSSTEIISIQAGGLNGYGAPGSGAVNPLTIKDLEAVERVSSVERVIRRNIPTLKVEFNDKVIFGFGTNIPDGDDRRFVYDLLELESLTGRMLKNGDTNKVVVGYNYYNDGVGFDKQVVPGDKILIQGKKFEVVGILKKKGSFILDNIILMNEAPLKELVNYGDNVDVIAAKIKSKDLVDKAKEDIERALRKSRGVKIGEEDFEVSTPAASLETVNSILTGVQIFIILIASISIVVGAIGIVNTMTTSVMERKKEIGVMKAIGAKNSQIFFQFFIESGLLGLIGSLAGIILGSLLGYIGISAINNYIGSETQIKLNLMFIMMVLTGGFIVGAISGIAPALNAARQNPVEALRG